jgi:hypothetical protein
MRKQPTYFNLADVPDKYKNGSQVMIRKPGKIETWIWKDKWMQLESVYDGLSLNE